MNDTTLQIATVESLPLLLPFVRAYHEFEGISLGDESRKRALAPLLREEDNVGRIWLIHFQSEVVGYITLCFGYSIELGGKDAFVDEFFISEPYRGRGIGKAALTMACANAAKLGICALHLEVAHHNARAQKLYTKMGFVSRDRFFIMSRHTP